MAPYLNEAQFDIVFASTLQRAYKTAKILTKGKKKIIKDSRLLELRMGTWKKDVEYADCFNQLGDVQSNYVKFADGAESFAEIKARCQSFLADLKQNHAGQTVLVAVHGILLRAMMSVIFDQEMNDITNLKNVGFIEVYFDEKYEFKPFLRNYNSTLPQYYGRKRI
ncbi:histidine phosphatase family protein [Lactobacillus xujianguonis]|uniref:histidine phosphatase family protein n=1 Tax=Lactobacillus xujianguonis TaxID=2495899 RepID=UPI001FEB48DC|nr:histidine phosphatase family protein [Lactobacillus xujianguonis]